MIFMPAKGIVSLLRQSIYILVPGLDMYALYKIKKLRLGLLITVLPPLAFIGIMYVTIGRYPQSLGADVELAMSYQLANLGVIGGALVFWVWLIRRWSKKWNGQFSESM